jgi:alpha-tubulin suppressor-like RCC1 family protein
MATHVGLPEFRVGELMPKAVALGGGSCHSTVVTEDGCVYSFGKNSRGQLGLPKGLQEFNPTKQGHSKEDKKPKEKKKILKNGKKEGLEGSRVSLTASERELGTASKLGSERLSTRQLDQASKEVRTSKGNLKASSKEGLNATDVHAPLLMPPRTLGFERVVDSACGGSHTLLLTSEGHVYGFGRNKEGQLGLGDKADRLEPAMIPPERFQGRRPVMVACGSSHSVVLCAEGFVFVFGDNQCGQLGLEGAGAAPRYKPTLIPRPQFASDKIVHVSCGVLHTVFVGEEGGVFTCGWNQDGQLGVGDTKDRPVPTRIASNRFSGFRPTSSACGEVHTLVCCQDGTVFGFGWNEEGQIGLGKGKSTAIPLQVPADKLGGRKVSSMGCGHQHSVLCCKDGTVYVMGANEVGQLGIAEKENKFSPIRLSSDKFDGKKITRVVCGWKHSLAIAEDGTVYGWGAQKNGQSGTGPPNSSPSPQRLLGELDYNCGEIVNVQAVDACKAILCKNGLVYAIGQNPFGQFGIGRRVEHLDLTKIWPPIDESTSDKIAEVRLTPFSIYLLSSNGDMYGAGALLGYSFLLINSARSKAQKDGKKLNKLPPSFDSIALEWQYIENNGSTEAKKKMYENFLQSLAVPPWEDQNYRHFIENMLYEIRDSLPDNVKYRLSLNILPTLIERAEQNSLTADPSGSKIGRYQQDIKTITQYILSQQFIEKHVIPAIKAGFVSRAIRPSISLQPESKPLFTIPPASGPPQAAPASPVTHCPNDYTLHDFSSDMPEMQKFWENFTRLHKYRQYLDTNIHRLDCIQQLGLTGEGHRKAYLHTFEQVQRLKLKITRLTRQVTLKIWEDGITKEVERLVQDRDVLRIEYKDRVDAIQLFMEKKMNRLLRDLQLARQVITDCQHEHTEFYGGDSDDSSRPNASPSTDKLDSPIKVDEERFSKIADILDNLQTQLAIREKLDLFCRETSKAFGVPYHQAAKMMLQSLDAVRLLERQARIALLEFGDLRGEFIRGLFQ